MSNYTDLYTTQTMSTTGTRERDVADTIRHLFPSANIMPFVSSGKVPMPDGTKKEKGMFGKREVHSPKFEAFTQSPLAVSFTAVSLSSTTLTLASTAGLVAKYSLVNTANGTTCNINSVTNTTAMEVTTYGGTAFSVAAGDVLLVISPHYEEKSSSPAILFSEPDNMYNVTYIARHAVGISDTAKQSKHFGGDRYMHIKQQNGIEAMRKFSNNLLFDNKPASSAEKNTSGLGTSFGSCDGLVQWAQTTGDAGGNMTFEWFMQDMPLAWHESVATDDKHVMVCGYKVWSVILGWQNAGMLKMEPGTYDKYGVWSQKIVTCRGWVEIVVIDAYNRGSYAKQALIMNPEAIDFVYLKNRDIQLRSSIQNNDVDGVEDEIYGEISICPNDAGYSLHTLTNLVA